MQVIPKFVARGVVLALALALVPAVALAQEQKPPADESALGEFVVTGTPHEHITRLAILPSLSPDMADVIVRGVVRRDFQLTGMFDLIADKKAPEGLYGFNDPVDINAWKKLGAEVIVKLAARAVPKDKKKVQVYGLCYFLNVGKDPVYQKQLIVDRSIVRVTAHRITDALLGAITGRPGGFASHFTFSGKWGTNRRIFTMDSDGNDLKPVTSADVTAIAPTWGPGEKLLYTVSKNYAPFKLMELSRRHTQGHQRAVQDVDLQRRLQQGQDEDGRRRCRKARQRHLRRPARRLGNEEGIDHAAGDASGVEPLRQAGLDRRRGDERHAARVRRRQGHLAQGIHRGGADLLRHRGRHPARVRRGSRAATGRTL